MPEINREKLVQQTSYEVVEYNSPSGALLKYGSLPISTRLQMAKVYRQAFQGKPWFEKFECDIDGPQQNSCCTDCGKKDLAASYQTPKLVEETFPKMLSDFSPGALVIAKNQENGIIGFCCGGMTTLNDLIRLKYNGNKTIQQSIMANTRLSLDLPFFYQDEMCVLPEFQGLGIGSAMDQVRLDWIDNRRIDLVYGRSINPNLLGMKMRHMPKRGFEVKIFRPEGDTYVVENNPRRGYFAQR